MLGLLCFLLAVIFKSNFHVVNVAPRKFHIGILLQTLFLLKCRRLEANYDVLKIALSSLIYNIFSLTVAQLSFCE